MSAKDDRAIGPVQRSIQDKLEAAFEPSLLEVINESHLHNVPPGSEMHFKVVVVSGGFSGQLPLARHRSVHRALREELDNGLHALTITSVTPDEWKDRGGFVADSPKCQG